MASLPPSVAAFLASRRIAVAGVSRQPQQAANAIYRKLRHAGYDVVPVNPGATSVEGVPCYRDLAAVPHAVDGLIVAAPPAAGTDLVTQAADAGVRHVWFHRSVGQGSVSDAAVHEAAARGLACIVGGCPLMYLAPVDPFHWCLRRMLRWRGRVPG